MSREKEQKKRIKERQKHYRRFDMISKSFSLADAQKHAKRQVGEEELHTQ